MATTVALQWKSDLDAGTGRSDRRGGRYLAYVPDDIAARPLTVSPSLAITAAKAERAVRRLGDGSHTAALEGISRFLLRSEAIASSMIEGVTPSPQQVALAELAQQEPVRGFSDQARLVANNITVLRRASGELADADVLDVDHVLGLHAALLPAERHQGLRGVQNWIGGSSWHPLDADFVPPPWDKVPDLMADLVSYMNGSAHAPLIQAALVHAQFETIHPFTDGNGRVGRALIHTVLTRRGLTEGSILPISLVLATLRERYVDGLTAYRYPGAVDSTAAHDGAERWIQVFLEATLVAAEQAERLASDIAALRSAWEGRVARHRLDIGVRQTPRSDSATARVLAVLAELPIMTTRTVQRLLDVSFPTARAALDELAESGVLHRRSLGRNATGYLAWEIFDLVGHTERRLASTAFDTRVSPPARPVPASPDPR